MLAHWAGERDIQQGHSLPAPGVVPRRTLGQKGHIPEQVEEQRHIPKQVEEQRHIPAAEQEQRHIRMPVRSPMLQARARSTGWRATAECGLRQRQTAPRRRVAAVQRWRTGLAGPRAWGSEWTART